MWLNLYEPDSPSYELIENIRDTYYLVAIIDNDYIGSKEGSSLWKKMLDAYHLSARLSHETQSLSRETSSNTTA